MNASKFPEPAEAQVTKTLRPIPPMHPDVDGVRIDPVLARSWLLPSGSKPELFETARRSRADIIVYDVEDAVAPQHKPQALADVIEWIAASEDPDWVRVNGPASDFWEGDLTALAPLAAAGQLGGIFLPMVEDPADIERTAARLPGVKIVPMVETARSLENIMAIASSPSTFRLAFGIGDFRRDTGFGEHPATLTYVRSRFSIASRAAGLPGAIDGPTVGSSGLKLREASAITKEFGMTGKICLTAEQTLPINESLSPSPDEIVWAKEFLADFDARGQEIRTGADVPRIASARKILNLALQLGIAEARSSYKPDHLSPPPTEQPYY